MKRQRPYEAAGEFIVQHPIPSWVIWVLLFFTVNRAFAAVAPLKEPARLGVLAWITVGALIWAPVSVAIMARRAAGSGGSLVMLIWSLASAPLLISYAALFDRAPQWFVALALAEAVVLMTVGLRRGKRAFPSTGNSSASLPT